MRKTYWICSQCRSAIESRRGPFFDSKQPGKRFCTASCMDLSELTSKPNPNPRETEPYGDEDDETKRSWRGDTAR